MTNPVIPNPRLWERNPILIDRPVMRFSIFVSTLFDFSNTSFIRFCHSCEGRNPRLCHSERAIARRNHILIGKGTIYIATLLNAISQSFLLRNEGFVIWPNGRPLFTNLYILYLILLYFSNQIQYCDLVVLFQAEFTFII